MKYQAGPGQIWVCAACGKSGTDRTKVGDESCFMHLVLCETVSIRRDPKTGRVVDCQVVTPPRKAGSA